MEDEMSDGDIVWVKVSNSWWPGEVMGESRLSEEFLSSLRKKPLAVVKFFQEDSYEYVKNPNFIFKYNCPRKNEFLRKGLEQYRAKMKHMEKFPSDVMHAERVTGGDPDIVNSTDFQAQKKERYSGLFQDGRSSTGKGKSPKEKPNPSSSKIFGTPISFGSGRKTIHEVRILAQPSSASTDSEAIAALPAENVSLTGAQSLLSSPGQVYHCYKCNNYSANRQNLIMLHIKHCRASYTAASGLSSSTTTTSTAPARKVSYEKEEESAEEIELEPDSKIDQSRRSLPTTSKTKSFGSPIRNVELSIPAKVELSSEKRTRRGRKTTPLSDTQKHKKLARGRNKRGQSPEQDENESSVAKLNDTEDNRASVNADKPADIQEDDENRRDQPNVASVTMSRDESTVIGIKNSTDVKFKNELLADWSEDEQEEDEGVKGQEAVNLEEDISVVEKKIPPPKDISPVKPVKSGTKKQHKESKQESIKQTLASKKVTKLADKNDASTFCENVETAKGEEAKNDLDSSLDDTTTAAAVKTVTLATVSSASAANTIVPTAATVTPTASPHATIKYRNIPKKQKREFIEVTNDDVSMVQEKHTVPSREGSTASSSSTTGSNELCIGNSQSTAPVPAERPISAKQLILNRATRGSSKSLSGDENTTTTSVSADNGGTIGNASTEQKSQSDDAKKKTESSCFDFNDDEEERQQSRASHISTATTTVRLDRKTDPSAAAHQKSALLDPEPQEVDRDVKLSQEIDSLLCEMDVSKLPEALSDVMAGVSDKIDCNRTLPPKERGKRIFKTRNKTAATISPSLSPSRNDYSGEVIAENKSQAEKAPDIHVGSQAAASNVAKDKSNKKPQTCEEEKRIVKDKNEPKKEEDHQNPSVTSSAMSEDMITLDVERQQAAKKKRKSEEILLPDSSGNGDQLFSSSVRRRGKFTKGLTESSERPNESASSSRKSKRNRREVSSLQETSQITVSNDKETEDNNATERTSRKMETTATTIAVIADGNTTVNDALPLKKQSIETQLQLKKEELIQTKKSSPPPSVSLASEPTATDLQVAEALINLPVASTVLTPVSSSSTGNDCEEKNVPIKVHDAGEQTKEPNMVASSSQSIAAVVGQSSSTAKSSSSSSSNMTKSINPRKRHLQSMMLTTTEETNLLSKKLVVAVSSDSSVPSQTTSTLEDEIVTMNVVVPVNQDPSSIPEKNKQNETTFAEEQAKELAVNDKFDISNMPIVMDDSVLLADEASPVMNAAAITVMKGVNGAGTTAKVGTAHPLTTTSTRDKRQTTVATVKGGRASKEQIVITSKGTVLTTSTPSVAFPSKFSTSSKAAVSVTSAITLSSSCRLASSTPTLPPNGSQQTSTTSSSPPTAAASSVTTQLVAPKIILTKKPLTNTAATPYAASTVKSDAIEGGKSKAQDRRASGDGASSSVSSSSGSDAGSKKSHRVLRLTPQKLKEFSRLGYIEDRQGKGKMLTKSGMRQLYGKQAQLKQLQRVDQLTAKKKPAPISTKLITTTEGADVVEGSDSTTSPRATLPEVASSGSNVVIAAAADSSVQESSALTARTALADPSVADIDEEEEMLEQHHKVTTEMELPASSLVAPAGATILLEGSTSSSGTTPAEIILGSTAELAVVGGSATEASSSSGSSTAATSGGVQDSSQLVAVTAENFGGPPNLFYLCSVRDETFVRVNDELLYLDPSNQLVALPEQHQQHPSQQQGPHHSQQVAGALAEDIIHQAEVILPTIGSNGADLSGDGTGEVVGNAAITDATGAAVVNDGPQQSFLLNTQDGQHIILDQQSLMALAAGGDTSHIITADGQQIVLQETAQEWLAALSASQQAQQPGTVSTLVTPEGTQIIVAHENAGLIELQEHPVLLPTEIMQVNPNTTIETNAVLTKPPIMSTVEVPSKNGIESANRCASEKRSAVAVSPRMASSSITGAGGSTSSGPSAIVTGTSANLDETLAAVIGHVPSNPHVPTSLELPITVTNPVIAKTSTASSRINSALFPLTTTATAVSSLADPIPAATAVVLVSSAEVPGTIDRVPSTSSLAAPQHCSSPTSSLPVMKGDRHALDADESVTVLDCNAKPYPPTAAEPTIALSTEEDDIQIPNTPESQQNNERHQQLDDEFSDGAERGDDVHNDIRHHLLEDGEDDESNSTCSEIIAIQPNVVVLDAELLLNSPPNDDGIDDEMENDSEDEDRNEVVVQVRSYFEQQQPLQQPQHRSRNVAARSTNGGNGDDGRPDTINLAEQHNSSNNDSGIDTSMASAVGGGAVCEATASSASVRESGPVRRTIVER
ncbi:mucin-17-like [Anopheles moucheti]|uniref:mucin-17-like n=1 Tax=Anopheles moucheti TaxID=186751 RepID=UPI0022F03762|nr:mucin-17-like [Anopheles moucheti]